MRCLNKKMIGIRFINNSKKIEVVIGTPCNQVISAFKDKNGVQLWGVVLSEAASSKIHNLLK